MTFVQELSSWNPFNNPQTRIKDGIAEGSQAPSTPHIPLPREDKKPIIISFLRHCGCPFAEKAFRQLREIADKNPNICCIAISHSDKSATEKWLEAVGGRGKVDVQIDDNRQTFAEYGLGYSSFWAVLNPWSMKTAMTIGKNEGYQIRPTESGSRWQTAGLFAVDGAGKLTYAHKANTSDDMGDLEAAVKSVSST